MTNITLPHELFTWCSWNPNEPGIGGYGSYTKIKKYVDNMYGPMTGRKPANRSHWRAIWDPTKGFYVVGKRHTVLFQKSTIFYRIPGTTSAISVMIGSPGTHREDILGQKIDNMDINKWVMWSDGSGVVPRSYTIHIQNDQ